jgi:hypoxanthine phosphoribosyltransferase
MNDLKVLIQREKIAERVGQLGADITRDFAGQSVIFVGVLKGAAIFLADLARQVKLDSTFDFIGVSSYGNRPSPSDELASGWDSTGEVRLTKDVDQSMRDKNVILVEEPTSSDGAPSQRAKRSAATVIIDIHDGISSYQTGTSITD